MIFATALALAAQAAPAPAPDATAAASAQDEIVVIGQRLKEWRGTWRLVGDKVACKTLKSTGDTAIDAIGCQAMLVCIGPEVPAIESLAAQAKDKVVFKQQLDAKLQTLVPCLDKARTAGIAGLAKERGRK
ncbi:hypothetical protein [Sphingomonas sp.]|uniref:hypothetical protein n=1 Tax=Sphingomonas sp. TaxID=28214 RepID=UPI001EB802AA|nr:hypothetical protein [Sphingomonas sp.]MBX3593455.1 hypothetical protein [Sphingomonas sp.]